MEHECVLPLPPCLLPLLKSAATLPTVCAVQAFLVSPSSGKGERIQDIQPRLTTDSHGLLETSQFRDYSVVAESEYVWVVEDNHIDTELDKKIRDAYSQGLSNGTHFAGFSFNGTQYTVDFTTRRLSQARSPTTQQLNQVPPFWCYVIPETGLVKRLTDQYSEKIEEMYRCGGNCITIEGTNYTPMFSTSRSYLLDVNTLQKFPIARYPPVTSDPTNPFELKVSIYFKGMHEAILRMLDVVVQNCCSYTVVLNFPVDGSSQHTALHQVANITQRYCVGAQHDLIDNQIIVKLRGAKMYVETMHALLHSLIDTELQRYVSPCALALQQYFTACESEIQHRVAYFSELQQHISSSSYKETSWPTNWEPHKKGEDFKLAPIEEGSGEWKGVLKHMQETLSDVTIVGLERVQNRPLWEKYSLEKKQMKKRNVGKINEMLLFHGSRKTKPEYIASFLKGIDFRYSNKDKCMWGAGAYFAVNASYSDRAYAHIKPNNEHKQLILAQVLTGQSCSYNTKHDSSLTKPPELPAGKPGELYDTVNGETNGSIVYVVYDHDKSYPAYIITYKRG